MTENTPFVSRSQFLHLAKKGEEEAAGHGLRKAFIPDSIEKVENKAAKNPDRTFRFVISTETVDRADDTISVKGWKLANYRKSPVVLFGHDGRSPPIARASNVKVEDNKLKADAEFMDNDVDTTGRSDLIFRMVSEGFLKATSVGFMPIKYKFTDDEDRPWGIDFEQQELLEFSIVPVPANPECLIEASNKSIDLDVLQRYLEEILEDWEERGDTLLVPKKLAEKSYNTIKKSRKPIQPSASAQDDLLSRNLKAVLSQEDDNMSDKTQDKDSKVEEPEKDVDDGTPTPSGDEVNLSSQMEEIKGLLSDLSTDLKSLFSELKDALTVESDQKGGGSDDDDDDDDKGGGSDDDDDDDDKKSAPNSPADSAENIVSLELPNGIKATIDCDDPEKVVKFIQAALSPVSADAEPGDKKGQETDEDFLIDLDAESGESDQIALLKEILPDIVKEVVEERFNDILDQKRGKVK